MPLSKRQREVLLLICNGLTSQEIAERLGITKKTVEFHRSRVMESFGVHNAILLVRKAIWLGIVKA